MRRLSSREGGGGGGRWLLQPTVDETAVTLSAGDCNTSLGPGLGKGQAKNERFGFFR